jgi:tRNA modification GTPase
MDGADTIAAIATSAGIGAIGIVRVSGAHARRVMTAVIGRCLQPRTASYVRFSDADGTAIDEGIGLFFPAPHSYTGEDILELHGHGGPVVLNALLRRCVEIGARIAHAGEFTQRAFLNGKLDLAQAEAVADLIAAGSARAAKSAALTLTGEFSRRVQAFQADLTELRVQIEGSLDFPDEGIDFLADAGVAQRLEQLAVSVNQALRASRVGRVLRDGIRVAIIGSPNVGKSSIINVLCGDEVAIVTPVAGTTRDPVRETVAIDGIPLHIIDTAGIRDTMDPVEQIGVERTWKAVADADLLLLVRDVANSADDPWSEHVPRDIRRIVVHNKIDLIGAAARVEVSAGGAQAWISARCGTGVEDLRQAMVQAVIGSDPQDGEFCARERHVTALERSLAAINRAQGQLADAELAAEELRNAQHALSEITGAVTSDDLLGEIFSRFCIGK